MAWEIKGKIIGNEVAVRWDGHSYAKKPLMELYRRYLEARKGEFIGFPPDAGATDDYDRSAPAAYAAWVSILDEVTERSGDFPWEAHEEGEVF